MKIVRGYKTELDLNHVQMTCAGYIAHPSIYLVNGDAKSLKVGYYAGQS